MLRIAQINKMDGKGVTFVEVMISLVILLIVFMGLIQASLLSIDQNVRNAFRDEAVSIASEAMAQQRDVFSALVDTGGACAALAAVNRTIRNQTIAFNRCRVVRDLDASNRQVTLTVTWQYRAENFTHSIMSIVRNK